MRKNNPNTLFAALALSLALTAASCSEDIYTGGASGTDAVQIANATVGTPTRATADAAAFAEGDAIRLSVSADGSDAATYTLGTDGWSSTAPLVWGSTFPVTYHAAYPETATTGSFTLPADQSNGTAEANYMTASAEVSEKKALSLDFTHKTAQVIVKIASRAVGNEGTLTDAVIRSPHSGYANEKVTGSEVAITPQTASQTAAGEEARYMALVLPGTADGFKLFSVKVGGKEVAFTTDIVFEKNHIYEYTLTVGEDRVTLAGFTVKDWEEAKGPTASMTPQWDGQAADSYAGGDGSKNNPYQIANAAQLALYAREVNSGKIVYNKYAVLTSDIDLGGSNWTPIGTESNQFYSYFDGQGHTIRNLSITQSEITDVASGYTAGLFGYVVNASIRNLTVQHTVINISTTRNLWRIGVIAGYVGTTDQSTATIDNCHVEDAEITYVEDQSYETAIGGIAGIALATNYPSPITFSRCTVNDITVNSNSTSGDMPSGGILGRLNNGQAKIYACSASGTLTGRNTGGLVGENYGSLLAASGCYANCTLKGNTSAAIAILSKNFGSAAVPIIQWSYLAGLQSDALRKGVDPRTDNSSYPTKEDECHLVTDYSEVYAIVANPANTTTFTVDGTTYNVKDCWQDNGNTLPILKVSKDGTTTE